MDNLFEEWKKIDQETINFKPLNKEIIMEAIYQESTSTMSELKKRLKYKINWTIAIGIGIALFMGYHITNLGVVLGCVIILSYYVVGYFSLKKYHKVMGTDISGLNALEAMKHNHNSIKRALKSEETLGRFFFPIVAACGLIISGSIKEMTLIEIVTNNRFLIIFAITVLIVIPTIMYLANKMNDQAYGSYINDLEKNIKKMEQA